VTSRRFAAEGTAARDETLEAKGKYGKFRHVTYGEFPTLSSGFSLGLKGPAMEGTATITPEAVRVELERVLASAPFANSHRSQRFLRFVVEASLNNVEESLKEFAIAVDVFGRNTSYDPSIDATVRVEAGRLRTRLREYYAEAGRNDPIVIDIPKGGYRATFSVPARAESAPQAPPTQNDDIRKNRNRIAFGLAAVAVLLLTGWFAQRSTAKHASSSSVKSKSASSIRIIPLTNLSGSVWSPAFSPDGKQIAFVWDGENPLKGDVYVQLVVSGTPVRLTHTRSGFIDTPAWSPDGSQIAFGRCDDTGGAVYLVPAMGGTERKVAEVACQYQDAGPFNWTSDGKSLVFSDLCAPDTPTGIVALSIETGAKRCLTRPPVGADGDNGPVLSPDRQTVVFTRSTSTSVEDIYTVSLAGGSARRLTSENTRIEGYMWTPDGRSIIFRSSRSGLPTNWQISAEGGAIQPETTYPDVGALSLDGAHLAYLGPPLLNTSVLWRADLSSEAGEVSGLRQLLPESAHDYAPQPSPDGRQIVFESERSGSDEIWKCNADGSSPLRLTTLNGHAGTPRWSPDGKWIAFDYRPSEHSQIFLIDERGQNLHSIASASFEDVVPSWSRDGSSIYFASNRTGNWQVWRVNLATGQATQITHNGGFASFESYDRKTIYFSKLNGAGVWSVPSAGGPEQRITKAPHLGYWGEFAVTEHGLYLIDSDEDPGPSVMHYSFQTRRLSKVLTFKNETQHVIPWQANLGVSRDGKSVLFVLGTSKSSILMAQNFQ
jgi:Tol biopolymer transport system component